MFNLYVGYIEVRCVCCGEGLFFIVGFCNKDSVGICIDVFKYVFFDLLYFMFLVYWLVVEVYYEKVIFYLF